MKRVFERGEWLFVYGTLRPCFELEMAEWLRRAAEHAGAARVRGRLYDLGAYPGLVESPLESGRVAGDLYRLEQPRRTLRVLDAYEEGPRGRDNPLFLRVGRTVESERFGPCRAWVYVYQRPVLGSLRIDSGDYALHAGKPLFST